MKKLVLVFLLGLTQIYCMAQSNEVKLLKKKLKNVDFAKDEENLNKVWADTVAGFKNAEHTQVLWDEGHVSEGIVGNSWAFLIDKTDYKMKRVIEEAGEEGAILMLEVANKFFHQWAEHNAINIIDSKDEWLGKKMFRLERNNRTIGQFLISYDKKNKPTYVMLQLYDIKEQKIFNKEQIK